MQPPTVHPNRRLLLHAQWLIFDFSDLNLHALLFVDRWQKVLNHIVLPVLHRSVPFNLLCLQIDIFDIHPRIIAKVSKRDLHELLSKKIV